MSIYDINNPPILAAIGNRIAVEGELFTLQVTATDADNDTLTYYANTSLFTINPTTGLISFTPTLVQVGNYSINIFYCSTPFCDKYLDLIRKRQTPG